MFFKYLDIITGQIEWYYNTAMPHLRDAHAQGQYQGCFQISLARADSPLFF